jgi:hypothetical protein
MNASSLVQKSGTAATHPVVSLQTSVNVSAEAGMRVCGVLNGMQALSDVRQYLAKVYAILSSNLQKNKLSKNQLPRIRS